jgi:hypothetical protein
MNDLDYRPEVERVKTNPVNTERSGNLTNYGGAIHICDRHGEWQVWLNTEARHDFSGLAIGSGATRAEAVRTAVETLERAVEVLQGPEPIGR